MPVNWTSPLETKLHRAFTIAQLSSGWVKPPLGQGFLWNSAFLTELSGAAEGGEFLCVLNHSELGVMSDRSGRTQGISVNAVSELPVQRAPGREGAAGWAGAGKSPGVNKTLLIQGTRTRESTLGSATCCCLQLQHTLCGHSIYSISLSHRQNFAWIKSSKRQNLIH